MRPLLALLAALAALAAPAARAQPATTVDPLTVEAGARRLEERVHTYVRGAVVKETNQSLIRWRRPICPLVAGLEKDQGEFVLRRISQVAAEVGAGLGGPDCRPNVYVVVTPQPRALLKAWRKRDSNLFGHQLEARIERFIRTDRPIRVWHNWAYESVDAPDNSRLAGNWRAGPPVAGFPRESHITDNVVRNDWGAVAVVDTAAVRRLSLGQLAAYVAMTVLTEFDLDADLGDAPTILRVFGAAEPEQDLSAWDLALLKALYATPQELRMQRQVVTSRVAREVAR